MKLIAIGLVALGLAACDNQREFPPIEAKAAKICLDAGLVPDSHMKPYRCYIPDDDVRLK